MKRWKVTVPDPAVEADHIWHVEAYSETGAMHEGLRRTMEELGCINELWPYPESFTASNWQIWIKLRQGATVEPAV